MYDKGYIVSKKRISYLFKTDNEKTILKNTLEMDAAKKKTKHKCLQ